MIKFKGQVIHTGPVGRYVIHANWNNSMQQYYPELEIQCIGLADGLIEKHYYDLNADLNPYEVQLALEVIINEAHLELLKQIDSARNAAFEASQAEIERKTIRIGKDVRVFKGRKVPIGTEGRIFWVGSNYYGESAGIELVSGKRIFVATQHLEVI